MTSSRLPAFALFPIAAWRDQLPADEWVSCLNAWVALLGSHLSLSDPEFSTISINDDSLQAFLTSFAREVALGGAATLGSSSAAKRLVKDCFSVVARLLRSPSPPPGLVQWEFLSDLSRVYGKKKVERLLDSVSANSKGHLDSSLSSLKRFLIKNMDAGLNGGDLKGIEERLERVNDLIRVSTSVAEFFVAGSDFVDGLISCYKITNPPLRRALIATTYLCLTGLAEGQKMSALTDQLYSLKAAADTHRAGPLNANDSLVAELVTSTPLLQRLQRKLEESATPFNRTKSVLAELSAFKKPGGGLTKPKRLIKRKIDKGKGIAEYDEAQAQQDLNVHRMSQISQIQDLFPDLGTAFISKLLDEYASSTEEVISHLLDDSLPPHLQSANRSEDLAPQQPSPLKPRRDSFVPRPTPPLSPSNPPIPNNNNDDDDDNDDDDLALLAGRAGGKLHIGKRPGDADALLAQRPTAGSKSAILSALAAFDSDDDERDDTYDAADVGGTVDASASAPPPDGYGYGYDKDKDNDNDNDNDGASALPADAEATLFRAWMANPGAFARDTGARKGSERARLRAETGMRDEAIEGWAVMLGRDAGMKRRLTARYGEWTGEQAELPSTAWRAGDDREEGGSEGTSGGRGRGVVVVVGGGRGRGRGRGGRGGSRGGGAAASPGPDSDLARRRKEANKGSRANHNRRDQRARKMARAGFAG
ncbi:hypothetical protein MYCTH_2305903 [Thermothelomyces thermophilus ATCC 42464]|uniref:CUE domain-containing protein n=1 Tax=Thermothelomyces thermophilus (strain ATCC 42464 / BCRC 31852 / DSM 1799) TaxID=573729 RepID=G2QG52_THET4|nr:uncharacterized protein MYCTH_2305903 [Thermothelomyces thermophilus ATCC 42464]AEO58517.1 hypothetical protein MYCTH_2305903 [Thermothelomyces thermophilus ATCC 42464]